ncbi:hypothetical protein CUMW_192870 [Citrus unshiu]|uniref:EF-hand domain-containing protein n=1 Tax=Citrus unshiu TaxID=55188 RepID=A0A2H5Q3I4_CITUN|nr:hypothetical protein CUMW_192870 [Citrus unshiu]
MTVMETVQSEQLKQLKDIFMRFDMDSDGSLTQLELAALLRAPGLKPTGDQLHILLADMDSNGNSLVEFDELVALILPDISEQVLVNQEQLMEVFRSFDRYGNGYITAAELAGSMAIIVTVASGLPDTDKWQAEFGAVSIQNKNGLPDMCTVQVTVASGLSDSKNRKSGFGAVSTRTKAANRMSINGKPVTTKNVHNG